MPGYYFSESGTFHALLINSYIDKSLKGILNITGNNANKLFCDQIHHKFTERKVKTTELDTELITQQSLIL